jgi:two-component system sensor histidine kinase RegB
MPDWNDILGLKPLARVSTVRAASLSAEAVSDTSSRKNMILLIQLRWLAVAGQVVTIAVVQLGMGIPLPLREMSLVLVALVVLNLSSLKWLGSRSEVDDRGLFVALVLDVVALTVQLYFSGGAANPFIFLYLLQVTLAAVLLDARSTWAIGLLACACFAGLATINRPLVLPSGGSEDLFRLHIAGTLVAFALDVGLLVVFVTRITRNLRERDAYLAAYRQHAIEEDHIVRMGLLASGAAHELGTPLSSLDVILGDWRHLPALSADPEIMQEVLEMQAAVRRCKSIVSGILISSGEARGEAPSVTTVNTFLNGLIADWRSTRPTSRLQYSNLFGDDIAIVSDSALKQVIFNVLDNAFEVSPERMRFTAVREGEKLLLRVEDWGPGFAEEMLAQFGKPYQSSKGRPGGGLGLFLVVNVARKLGGTASAINRFNGGALVSIELPLETLMIRQDEHVQ